MFKALKNVNSHCTAHSSLFCSVIYTDEFLCPSIWHVQNGACATFDVISFLELQRKKWRCKLKCVDGELFQLVENLDTVLAPHATSSPVLVLIWGRKHVCVEGNLTLPLSSTQSLSLLYIHSFDIVSGRKMQSLQASKLSSVAERSPVLLRNWMYIRSSEHLLVRLNSTVKNLAEAQEKLKRPSVIVYLFFIWRKKKKMGINWMYFQ